MAVVTVMGRGKETAKGEAAAEYSARPSRENGPRKRAVLVPARLVAAGDASSPGRHARRIVARVGRMKAIRRNLGFILFMLALLTTRASLADHYVVPTGSMEPTLMPGDRVVVDKRAYGLRIPFTLVRLTAGDAPARGDVVVFDAPDDGTRLIKRVVAVGGDLLEVRAGHAFVNGVGGDARAAPDLRRGGGPDVPPVRVPAGHVFVMGDFRGNSRDSRFFGFVRESDLYARATRVYYRSGEGLVWKAL